MKLMMLLALVVMPSCVAYDALRIVPKTVEAVTLAKNCKTALFVSKRLFSPLDGERLSEDEKLDELERISNGISDCLKLFNALPIGINTPTPAAPPVELILSSTAPAAAPASKKASSRSSRATSRSSKAPSANSPAPASNTKTGSQVPASSGDATAPAPSPTTPPLPSLALTPNATEPAPSSTAPGLDATAPTPTTTVPAPSQAALKPTSTEPAPNPSTSEPNSSVPEQSSSQ